MSISSIEIDGFCIRWDSSSLKGTYENNQKFTFILSIVLFLCFFNAFVSKSGKRIEIIKFLIDFIV